MTHKFPSPPPEWAPQDTLLVGWPSHFDPWGEPFAAAREEIAGLANAILNTETQNSLSKTGVTLVLDGEEAEATARKAVPGAGIINMACGDTWLRDTGAIFTRGRDGLQARSFGFNGWGGKYIYPGDSDLSLRLAKHFGALLHEFDFVLEGGSVDCDGAGRLLTTNECLLNDNRNVGWTREQAEGRLKTAFGVEDIIWVAEGLLNDHTDGHIDNLARFIGPGHVLCQRANGDDDPHAERLFQVEKTLRSWRSAKGEGLKVSTLPSPGRVLDEDDDVVPASHMNFVITNQAVIMPSYNANADAAIAELAKHFPGRKVMARPANAVLTGGGAFHCISQQIPAAEGE